MGLERMERLVACYLETEIRNIIIKYSTVPSKEKKNKNPLMEPVVT